MQSRGEPRYSLSHFALAVALTSTLNPKLHTTRGTRVRLTRKACNIDSMDSANAESQADSTIAKVAKHDFATIKLNRTKCKPLKASSGGGYIRGRGDFAI
ncbi:hypothetical protein [Helicobacter bilis]|uniref:hypothetical protein n=1 Tax=Helicobacter bilis TaxID=37372 RepID=UPI0025AA1CA7|nr:hypothetical protein [Helicobacter bilis]